MTNYYVGTNERVKAESIREAYRIASELIGAKEPGKSVKIYRGPTRQICCSVVEVLPNHKQKLCFVVFQKGHKTGHALTIDYNIDKMLGTWDNIKYGGVANA